MVRKLRFGLIILVVCFMFNTLAFAQSLPTLVDVNPSAKEGDWLIGATPYNYDPNKPVLVFVQGLDGSSKSWYGETMYTNKNDMYDYAYNAGYRTAFVELRDSDGNAGSMWRNGSTLSNQLKSICEYFGVSKVNLVCHSKGGVDSQTAIVHYGAYKYVDKVFTLSTPHWGSQLADLANSWYAGWLADIVGYKSDGTYVLQTSYMDYFRSITDNRSENDSVKYYTCAGTNWGPTFSSLYFGGLYLSAYDSNDGAVTVTSAKNPRGTHIFTKNLHHDNIRLGNKVWSFIQPYIGYHSSNISSVNYYMANSLSLDSQQYVAKNDTILPTPIINATQPEEQDDNILLRGGDVINKETVNVPVDSSVKEATFNLMVSDPSIEVTLVSPKGEEYKFRKSHKDSDFFKGATHMIANVKSPKSGEWKLNLKSNKKGAYFMITSFDSTTKSKVNMKDIKVRNGGKLDLVLDNKAMDKKLEKFETSVVVSTSKAKERIRKVKEQKLSSNMEVLEESVNMPEEAGLYNMSVTIKGNLEDGSPYERTVVKSIVVDSDSISVESLKKLTE